MRRIRSALRLAPVLLGLLGLLVLAVVPAARAAETLVLTCHVCTKVEATGTGLPTNETVRLTLVDVRTGQQVGPTHMIQTDAEGSFMVTIPVDLSMHPSLESTVWKMDGEVLVVAAHNRINAPCKDGQMGEMGEHVEGVGETLSFTGSHAPQLLGLGLGLLALGALLLAGARRLRTVR